MGADRLGAVGALAVTDTCAICGVILQGRLRHLIEFRVDGRVRYLLAVCLDHSEGATAAVDSYLRAADAEANGSRHD